MPNEHTLDDLRELQAMPLLAKEMLTRARIHEWQVNSTLQGLGMKAVFDMVNEIYGKDFYRYD